MKLEVLLGKMEKCHYILCRAGALNSSKWDHVEKHCRVNPGESLCYKSSHRGFILLSPAKQRLRGTEVAVCKTSGGQAAAKEKSHWS